MKTTQEDWLKAEQLEIHGDIMLEPIGPIVSLIYEHGPISMHFGFSPDQARELAAKLVEAADAMDRRYAKMIADAVFQAQLPGVPRH